MTSALLLPTVVLPVLFSMIGLILARKWPITLVFTTLAAFLALTQMLQDISLWLPLMLDGVWLFAAVAIAGALSQKKSQLIITFISSQLLALLLMRHFIDGLSPAEWLVHLSVLSIPFAISPIAFKPLKSHWRMIIVILPAVILAPIVAMHGSLKVAQLLGGTSGICSGIWFIGLLYPQARVLSQQLLVGMVLISIWLLLCAFHLARVPIFVLLLPCTMYILAYIPLKPWPTGAAALVITISSFALSAIALSGPATGY